MIRMPPLHVKRFKTATLHAEREPHMRRRTAMRTTPQSALFAFVVLSAATMAGPVRADGAQIREFSSTGQSEQPGARDRSDTNASATAAPADTRRTERKPGTGKPRPQHRRDFGYSGFTGKSF